MRHPTVASVMTCDVAHAHAKTTFQELVVLMRRRGVSGVPVTDREDKVIGVVSEADLLRRRTAGPPGPRSGRTTRTTDPPPDATAAALMTTPALTIHPGQRAADAARIMDSHHINRLPVVDEEDRLIGIVTRHDLLRIFVQSDAAILAEVMGTVLPAVGPALPGTVAVRVNDGVVQLRGAVHQADLAPVIRGTWRVDGVMGIVNRLTIGAAQAG
ncbi:CBS domain-containing protein [Streptomyces orinoci]|uniref:CBS domain-containing protein n=1 Tax=Streptomyces orinoci TaxID=67339 RepID=A0ABV3K651_STRON|nr:CBS domain-containing protein [Streptomyces orinoci]